MEKQSPPLKIPRSNVTPQQMRWVVLSLFLALVTLWISCSTIPLIKKTTPLEQVKIDQDVGTQMMEHFQAHLKIKKDPGVEAYLDQLAKSLDLPPPSSPEYVAPPLSPADQALFPTPTPIPPVPRPEYQVSLVDRADGHWQNYSFPTETIFLSVPLLGLLTYENEIAADIAIEISHLQQRDLFAAAAQSPTWNDEVFDYSEKIWLSDVDTTIGILYRAGYDPRGLISLLEIYHAHPKNAVISPGVLDKMIERARRALATYSPLRNPVVRSKKFFLIRKRIQNL